MDDDESYPDEYHTPPFLGLRHPLNLVTGTPETGLWCETCLLPSRYEVPIYTLGGDGPINVGVFDRCDGCQA